MVVTERYLFHQQEGQHTRKPGVGPNSVDGSQPGPRLSHAHHGGTHLGLQGPRVEILDLTFLNYRTWAHPLASLSSCVLFHKTGMIIATSKGYSEN